MMKKNVCIALALISAACGGGGGGGSAGPTTTPINNTPPPAGGISVTNNAFTPATKTVTVGNSVVWAWNTCTGDPYGGNQLCASHNVTFDDGTIPPSPTQDQGTFSKTFTAAGTFNYHCTVHPMTGTITVVP